MSNFLTNGCAVESRRLVDDARDNASKNVNIDKIDSCSEVTLGLLSVFLVTGVIWALALPFFDVAGSSWMKSWEKIPGEISIDEFKANLYVDYPSAGNGLPHGAFGAMDTGKDSVVNFNEFDAFLGTLKTPMNGTTARYVYDCIVPDSTSAGFTMAEWKQALSESKFCFTTTTTTTIARPTSAPTQVQPAQSVPPAETTNAASEAKEASGSTEEPKENKQIQKEAKHETTEGQEGHPKEAHHAGHEENENKEQEAIAVEIATPPPEVESKRSITMKELLTHMGDAGQGTEMDALQLFDLDKDSFAAHGEFLEGLKKLPEPIEGAQAEGIFQALDTNKDSVVESEEFFKAFRAQRYVSARPEMPTTTQAPNPNKIKALQELGLTTPPLTFERLTESMGAVPPETVYEALDTDKNGEISEDELVAGGKAFAPPLTEVDSRYAHRGLDINADGRVVPAELFDTLKVGHFFPTMAQAQAAHSQ
eukprot:TRINITY_DN77487_c0_g1_i1.p1 TRINITY_DN77487_c0_g1~~TRINITY_DN77487_c0_g1_i1.p1  ORF type:complete len:479 (-),score=104.88 TRINITY_DN77487_c0_g1_i1:123-1559(-)